jgi:hypothetical protein
LLNYPWIAAACPKLKMPTCDVCHEVKRAFVVLHNQDQHVLDSLTRAGNTAPAHAACEDCAQQLTCCHICRAPLHITGHVVHATHDRAGCSQVEFRHHGRETGIRLEFCRHRCEERYCAEHDAVSRSQSAVPAPVVPAPPVATPAPAQQAQASGAAQMMTTMQASALTFSAFAESLTELMSTAERNATNNVHALQTVRNLTTHITQRDNEVWLVDRVASSLLSTSVQQLGAIAGPNTVAASRSAVEQMRAIQAAPAQRSMTDDELDRLALELAGIVL